MSPFTDSELRRRMSSDEAGGRVIQWVIGCIGLAILATAVAERYMRALGVL